MTPPVVIPEYSGPDWYASPAGSASGNGSAAYPFDLATAFSSAAILPGHTVWMRGGTYTGDYTCLLAGETDTYVTVRPYPGEQPVINGTLTVGQSDGAKAWVKMWLPRITNTSTARGSEAMTHDPDYRDSALTVYAPNSILIGGINTDGGVSVGHWAPSSSAILYGHLALNGGWMDELRGHGHAIYCQNNTGTKTIKHCIFGPHFGRTLACYGSEAGTNSGFRITENAFVERSEASALIGGGGRQDDQQFIDNHVVGRFQGQYTYQQNGAITATGNTIWCPVDAWTFLVGYWEAATVTGNTINGSSAPDDPVIKEMVRWTPPDDTTGMANTWNTNTYHYRGGETKPFKGADGTYYTYAEWQAATGFDAASTYDTNDTLPDSVSVYPNEYQDDYDPREGMVVIWNGSSANSVSVDLTTMGLVSGRQYKLIQALDPLVDVVTFTADGNPLSVDMRAVSHSVAKPVGWDVALVDTTFPRFGAFIVERA